MVDKPAGLTPVNPGDTDEAMEIAETGGNPLDVLAVIDRLEVAPAQVEPRRLVARYSVTRNGETHTNDLIYRFEEDVFTPGEPESLNLASMMSVQAAINYGLFCNEIVLQGRFDRHDWRFIKEMAQNTAREIFVKKFLEPNPFLHESVTKLPPVRPATYLRARILFREEESSAPGAALRPGKTGSDWSVDANRYAILSSGGKDSLLSYGLLKEIGSEVHPIFVNESGRHWFTALNAYRHFSANAPNTARVWTNADRIFTWMLRHLPFVRQDFAKMRSDEYPIRLWTVAVFLFGALPLMRKRNIGRLIIGDEYDTTVRSKHEGIPHFDGLYDQSRYFDEALTRYFISKGWGLNQFSILRPLSELLIEKTLVERYPELQRHQVSCHASHKEGDRVKPCGRCEKCRRIVGMLTAIGADPGNCGYSEEMIRHCLKSLAKGGIHQETEGAEHLGFLLQEKGVVQDGKLGNALPQKRPEILKLRFNAVNSPPECIPEELRKPLTSIFLQHAEGAVKRRGKQWVDFDPLTDPAFRKPYLAGKLQALIPSLVPADAESAEEESHYLLGKLTWPEAKARFKEVDLALLPVGSIEQHGPHLPVDTDAFDADYLARQVAIACKDPKPIVLPAIPYGVSYHHDDFSGTISISPDILSRLVYEIGMSAAKNGVKKLVIVNGHGGNSPALHFAAQMINRDAQIFTCVDTGETSDPDIYGMAETPNDVHAGEIETSTTLAVRPREVRLDKARKYVPRFSSRYLNFTSKRSVGWYAHTSRISQSGVMGDPTKASAEKGRLMWDVMIKNLAEFVEDLMSLSLEEIHQRRY